MKIKSIIKKIPFAQSVKITYDFNNEYCYDKRLFKKSYSHSLKTTEKNGYNILLIVHSVEKALSVKELRPFGATKIRELIKLLDWQLAHNTKESFACKMGVNCLRQYVATYEKFDWTDHREYIEAKHFVDAHKDIPQISVGSQIIKQPELLSGKKFDYSSFLKTRHSVRNFSEQALKEEDIEKAIRTAILSPSACNRQMCKVYYVDNKTKRNATIKIGQGFGCFDTTNANIFVITFDLQANNSIGERNQGWFNAGLFSMNFVNALHSIGIGSCFIQFANKNREEIYLKKLLNIPDTERIAVIISAGYYDNESTVPYSTRKDLEDIYRKIN